jgi:hypothetical protein
MASPAAAVKTFAMLPPKKSVKMSSFEMLVESCDPEEIDPAYHEIH